MGKCFGEKNILGLLSKVMEFFLLFCSHSQASIRSKSDKFISVPFTGICPDKLMKHESLVTHQSCDDDHRKFETRQASSSSVVEIIQGSFILTVDKGVFCDSLSVCIG